MTNSIIEITEREYLIKLDRNVFDLSVIRNILKMVEVTKTSKNDDSDSLFFNRLNSSLDNYSPEPSYFGSIEEK